jgi:hypothetical protein
MTVIKVQPVWLAPCLDESVKASAYAEAFLWCALLATVGVARKVSQGILAVAGNVGRGR